MILMIDNYDSFVFNLVQYLNELDREVKVVRNDEISLEEIEKMDLSMIVISPGPCTPSDAGISEKIVEHFKGKLPILGICLGHQTIGQVFGGKIIRGDIPIHGKVSPINHNGKGVFKGLNNPLNVTRYHSLIIDRDSVPNDLEITAETEKGEIMGIRHKKYLIEGVQFHPEAILTEQGRELLQNFLNESKIWKSQEKDIKC